MARKGNQQKNGLEHYSTNHKKGDSDCELPRGKICQRKVVARENLPNENQPSVPGAESLDNPKHIGVEKKSSKKLRRSLRKEKVGADVVNVDQPQAYGDNSGDCVENASVMESSGLEEGIQTTGSSMHGPKSMNSGFDCLPNDQRAESTIGSLFSDTLAVERLKASILSILRAGYAWLERQKPSVITLRTSIQNVGCYIWKKIEYAYPIILRCLINFGNIMLLLSMIWLHCASRGIDSLLHMGTASFFSVVWCSTLSVVAMIGVAKFTMVLVTMALTFFLMGFTIGILVTAMAGIMLLWFYGSFWITGLVICAGGLAFMLSHGHLALLITTLYSVYCVWTSLGWFCLLLALNLSFISSDALVFFLKNNIGEYRSSEHPPDQTAGVQGQPGFFHSEPELSSPETSNGPSDRSSGIPSTSGADSEIASEDEVVRLLNCTDHYAALGLSRYENIDVTVLKREYRRKAMMVHPDKNMGNEKAAEAFKKLQNAYEVLLDSFKRKAYDNELRREELLDYFRSFQTTSSKNGRQGIFPSRFAYMEADGLDPLGKSRQIACRKCGNFHAWIHTRKSKSTARWCQDCKDFHQAKDGDGWVEQSSQPLFFGILQKVDVPRAFICADSKIYDVTEWYICQGMKCAVNTHKPSFHVNPSVAAAKHNNGKGTGPGQRGNAMPTSSSSSSSNVNMEEGMTEEEFFEWLQNALQAGMSSDFSDSMPTESPSPRSGNGSKGGGNNSSSVKRKKKGKKQR